MLRYAISPPQTLRHAYLTEHGTARSLLEDIAGILDNMPAPQAPSLNWGHVGDLKDITYRLSLIREQLKSAYGLPDALPLP